jgi:hypothetical protein
VSSRPPEIRNRLRPYRESLWILPAVAGMGLFTWLSFFIVGVRARRREWILVGSAYAVYSALTFFTFGRPEVRYDDTAGVWIGAAGALAWCGGIVHALVVNRAYLRQLGYVPAVLGPPTAADGGPGRRRRATTSPAPAPAGDDLGLGLGNPAADYLADSPPIAEMPAGSPPLEAPVEANTATQRTLTRLPGVTPERARRWISERRRRGGFRDIDELAIVLNLQPHEIVRLRPRLSFTARAQGPRRPRLPGRGRVLDV